MTKPLKFYDNIALEVCSEDGILDFDTVFSQSGPVEIEIGSGKGTFLLSQCRQFINTNFIGIEWASKYYRFAVDRLGRWDIKNVRMIRTDAAVFIDEHLAEDSVSGYHIYFPDPWPKARHNKRRLICLKNLMLMHRSLKSNGFINIATDHEQYFQWICRHISDCGEAFVQAEYILPAGAGRGEMAGTNFERKYLKQNRKVYTVAIRKN